MPLFRKPKRYVPMADVGFLVTAMRTADKKRTEVGKKKSVGYNLSA
jgi:hypothetical protein